MNVVATLAFAVLLLALQSSGVPPFTLGELSADLVLCLVVRIGMTRDLPRGGALVVVVGLLMDGGSGAPLGVHVVAFVAVFLGVYGMRHRLFMDSAPTIASAAFIASAAMSLLTWFLVATFLRDYHQYSRFAVLALPRALLTVPFMFPVRAVSDWIDQRTRRPAFGST